MVSKKLAEVVSIIFGPHVLLPLLFLLIIFRSGLRSSQLKIIFPTVLILQVVVPIIYLIFAPKLGWVEKWDMEKIKERKPFLYLMLSLSVASFSIIYFFGNQKLLHLSLIFLVLLVVFLLITHRFKISLHASLNTVASIVVNFLFQWKLPMLYLTIPIIFWARLKLKKHSKVQLMTGIVVSAAILFAGLGIFGYLSRF